MTFDETLESIIAYVDACHKKIAELEAEVQALRANSMIQEQIIKDGGNPFDKDKIVRLIMEKTALQSHDKEAMELLEAAIADIDTAGRELGWKSSGHVWRHYARYEALKAQSTAPTKNTDGEE